MKKIVHNKTTKLEALEKFILENVTCGEKCFTVSDVKKPWRCPFGKDVAASVFVKFKSTSTVSAVEWAHRFEWFAQPTHKDYWLTDSEVKFRVDLGCF